MNFKNAKLIFRRELSDQWRDRRTIFTIVVLPLVLYPLMGMALLQTAQFMGQEPARVLLVGSEGMPQNPPMFVNGNFNESLFDKQPPKLAVISDAHLSVDENAALANLLAADDSEMNAAAVQMFMKKHRYDLLFQVRSRSKLLDASAQTHAGQVATDNSAINIRMIANSTSDQSALATAQVNQLLSRWKSQSIKQKLVKLNLKPESLSSISVSTVDIATKSRRKAAMWAKLLPFIVVVWALTGAFYPAIDLCAGEKERGTLETLLSSPAKRSEIVAGKLMTVATFSFMTAMLNLLSMTITGLIVLNQMSSGTGAFPMDMGFPSMSSLPWLVVGLVPIVALFSSLALALASFARSSKEGQYYLIPLLMSLVPLMMLSMLPSAKLDMGTSLIPVTGMLLLLKNLMLSEYQVALQYVGPVLGITLVCCWMSARWAVYQFNNESVLFRSGEQFGVGAWLKHVVRDRGPLPTLGEAILCGVMILVIKFFVGLSAELTLTFDGFAKMVIISQVATIALPAILMALFLTRGPTETLKLKMPRLSYIPACMLLAILLHPAFMMLGKLVMQIYPPSAGLAQMESAVQIILADAPSTFAIIAVIAFVPAFCEEIAFRGFILSGLQSIRGKWTAIIISALLFGIAHGIIQQSIMASFVGVILGIIAVQTGSLLPCIAYHAIHNALPILMSVFPIHAIGNSYMSFVLTTNEAGAIQYTIGASIVMPLCGFVLLVWLWKFPNSLRLNREQQVVSQQAPMAAN